MKNQTHPSAPVPSDVEIAVVGAHLSGMPLNAQLTDLGSVFRFEAKTAPLYRLYALAEAAPAKPGMLRVSDGTGAAIAVEVWALSYEAYGRFVAAIPGPLGIGMIQLENVAVQGFLVEPYAVKDAVDITSYGGWRSYIDSKPPVFQA